MTKHLFKVERERVVTDWWYVEANDETNKPNFLRGL